MPMIAASAGTKNAAGNDTTQAAGSARLTPFIKASGEHVEKMTDESRALIPSEQVMSVIPVTALGFASAIVIQVTASGGSGAAVFADDAPFNVLKSIRFTEPGGQVIHNFPTGYDLYLANKWGGYTRRDPRALPDYSTSTSDGSFSFTLRIPLQINARNALGSLANQNSSSQYQVHASLAASTEVYSTPPATTLPTVRVRTYLEAWDQPEPVSGGLTNATTPPAPGTTQFWNHITKDFAAGENSIQLTRLGNYVRAWGLTFRDTSASRSGAESSVIPEDISLYWDHRTLENASTTYYRNRMFERTGYGANGVAKDATNGIDNGFVMFDWMHDFDGLIGYEQNLLWFPTLEHSRVEFRFNARAAGTLTIATNDVAPMGDVF